MTYDWADHYVVLFGGRSLNGQSLNDTWTWRAGVWMNITRTAGPAPPAGMYGTSLTYDAADGYVLAWGSCQIPTDGGCNNTWSFLHGRWSKIVASGARSPPGGVTDYNMVYDAADGYVLLLDDGASWKYVSGTWTELCGVPTSNCTSIPGPYYPSYGEGQLGGMVYDASDGYVVWFGGNYTWKYHAVAWTNITSSVGASPSYRFASALVYDNASSSVLLLGGLSGHALNDTWLFRSGTWQNLSASPAPPAGLEDGIAYDPADSGVVLFGAGNTTWMWGTDPPMTGLSILTTPANPQPGAPVSFSESFLGGVAPFRYSWRFGDGNGSSSARPSYSYPNVGEYTVHLWVNDSSNHSVSTVHGVTVSVPLGISLLKATPNPALLNHPVNFSVEATGGTPPYSYGWTFGDGGVGGNLSNITHIYATNGPFRAVVTVTDMKGATVQSSLNVSIELQAIAGFSAAVGSSPLTVQFVGQAQGGVPPYHYAWSFGDGSQSSLQNPRHHYPSPGQYSAVFTVRDSQNLTSSTTVRVEVGSAGGQGSSPMANLEIVGTLVAMVAGISAAWGLSTLYQRRRRREGEKWVQELLAQEPAPPSGLDGTKPEPGTGKNS